MKAITRRQFVAGSAAVTLAGAVPCAADEADHSNTPSPHPNILLIHVDQHRIDCLGAYGNPDIRTPNVDALARDGVRFEHSFCPFPVCTPSRYSLLSGRYVHEHRGWTNHCTLPPDTPTFPALLKDAGYKTKAIGKMHFTPTYLDVGFEKMVLSEQDGDGRWDDDYHRDLRQAGLVDVNDLEDQRREYRVHARPEYWETFGALPSNLPDAYHSTRWIGDHAVATLEGWGKGGHLLMAGFIKPHHPFDPPQSMANAYDPDKLTLLPGWTGECFAHDLALNPGYFPNEKLSLPALRRVMAYYYATIEHIDQQVGRMIAVLKSKGLYDDALIVFTGDHGEYLGFHHMLLKGNHMYDPLVKVPLIVKYPGGKQRGTVSHGLVNNVDVAPTIVRQAGLEPAATMHGKNLAAHPEGSDIVFTESGRGHGAMARTKTRKLILFGKDQRLFYDLEADPLELVDRSDDPACQDDVKTLTRAIEQWRGPEPLADTYLDENAPIINQPNVPSRTDKHRDEMIAYCQERMQAARG